MRTLGPAKLLAGVFVRADRVTTGRLPRNVPGVLVSAVDTGQDLRDSIAAWWERAMTGTLYGGTLVSDPRSDDLAAPEPRSAWHEQSFWPGWPRA